VLDAATALLAVTALQRLRRRHIGIA